MPLSKQGTMTVLLNPSGHQAGLFQGRVDWLVLYLIRVCLLSATSALGHFFRREMARATSTLRLHPVNVAFCLPMRIEICTTVVGAAWFGGLGPDFVGSTTNSLRGFA